MRYMPWLRVSMPGGGAPGAPPGLGRGCESVMMRVPGPQPRSFSAERRISASSRPVLFRRTTLASRQSQSKKSPQWRCTRWRASGTRRAKAAEATECSEGRISTPAAELSGRARAKATAARPTPLPRSRKRSPGPTPPMPPMIRETKELKQT